MTTSAESPAIWNEKQADAPQGAPAWLKPSHIRVRLDEPTMEAAIGAASLYCASILPPFTAVQKECEAFLVRLLRSRMRLVRAELLRRKLKDTEDEERLQFTVKEKRSAYLQLYLSPEEMTIVKEGLEVLGRSLERVPTDAERRLLLRFTVLRQAMETEKRPHSELVRELNRRRHAVISTSRLKARGSEQKQGAAGSTTLRLRMREWTVRAALFAALSYLRYNSASPPSWKRAYRLLERIIRLHRDVIVSQVKHGKPRYRLREGGMVRRGLGVEPNRQAYITPRLSIRELRLIREGLELRRGEVVEAGEEAGGQWRRQLNWTERVLLLKVTLLYGARYGVGRRLVGWQVGGLAKRMRKRSRTHL